VDLKTQNLVLECSSCGQPSCRVTLPEPTSAQSFGVEKMASALGAGAGARALLAVLADPKQLAAAVALTCLTCTLGQADGAR
jgi:hypothetical protein